MKQTLLLLCSFFMLAISTQAQETKSFDKSWRVGISFSGLGENDAFDTDDLIGAPSYDGDGYYAFGVHFIRSLNHWLELETGLEYLHHEMKINPNLPPNMEVSSRKEDFSLINIPLTVRANFLDHFFVNGGLLLDIDGGESKSITSQTGIGALLGVGIKHEFKCGASLFVNPYVKTHALLSFESEDYKQRLYESGVRFGVTYRLK